MMNVKMVEINENGGGGGIMYNVWEDKVEGKNFKMVVKNVFNKMMDEYDGDDKDVIDMDFYGVDGVVKNMGIIRFGEDCNVYVINEKSEWYNKDCESEEFYDYVLEVIMEL